MTVNQDEAGFESQSASHISSLELGLVQRSVWGGKFAGSNPARETILGDEMRNLVAKNARKFNRSAVHKDKKKEAKKNGFRD